MPQHKAVLLAHLPDLLSCSLTSLISEEKALGQDIGRANVLILPGWLRWLHLHAGGSGMSIRSWGRTRRQAPSWGSCCQGLGLCWPLRQLWDRSTSKLLYTHRYCPPSALRHIHAFNSMPCDTGRFLLWLPHPPPELMPASEWTFAHMCRWRPYSESTRIFSRRRATGTMQCRASATMSAGWHPTGQLCAPGLIQPRLPQCTSQGWRASHRPPLQLLKWQGLRLQVRLGAPLCILDAFEYALVHPSATLISNGGHGGPSD